MLPPTEIALWDGTNARSRADQFLGTAIVFDARSGLDSALSNQLVNAMHRGIQ
jgi:hypothetical protein